MEMISSDSFTQTHLIWASKAEIEDYAFFSRSLRSCMDGLYVFVLPASSSRRINVDQGETACPEKFSVSTEDQVLGVVSVIMYRKVTPLRTMWLLVDYCPVH